MLYGIAGPTPAFATKQVYATTTASGLPLQQETG
jgi:hypothetical protein